ncbi:FAD-dependent oxidoreductase [Ascidiimonas aurantiaca]|uniref:FAD-dependent oxidoreductase n=1 Tax=Ascidiimonas aurantiaca TaxID=1685432 RepID=UPI0030EF2287
MFDVLIIGGGAAGMQCALVLGSALEKPYAENKKTGIIIHQRASHLQSALFNNALGIPPGTTGAAILNKGKEQLATLYPAVEQIEKEKVLAVQQQPNGFSVVTNKNTYRSAIVVLAVGYAQPFTIKGLENYLEPHPMAPVEKNRVWVKNEGYKVGDGLYVAGTLAGGRSQFSIAAGSGAQVATDILTLWNEGKHTKVHDKAEGV